MTDLDLKIFFKDLEYMPTYDIEKIIYSETNNLDQYLFCSLNKRFNNYCLDWLKEKRANQTEYDLPRAKACAVYKYSPESNKLALLAENIRNNHIVINHYTLDENQIVFQVENFQLTGCYSIWYNYLYSEIYRFQKIMHDLFIIIEPVPNPDDKLLKNQDESIFKNDFAFTLFDKMKGFYKDASKEQADYSFLFDIMKKDGFVICTGKKFIDFVSKFNISMTKIDSSKTGNKDKATLYNATKGNLEEKHNKSTV